MTVGFAVIGTGNVSRWHIEAINSNKDARLAAIMSHDKNRAEVFAKKYNVKPYSNIDELLKDDEIDAVDIVSYHDCHVDYALRAVKAGKHVMVEKPIGTRLDGIDELIEESRKKNLYLGVISQHRLDGSLKKAKQMINDDELGKIIFANIDLVSNKPESYYLSSPWKTSIEKAGGGVLMMKAIHQVDVMLWLFGELASVYGKISTEKHDVEVEDTASALFKFKNNTIVSLHAATSASYNHPYRMMIYGERKGLLIEGNKLIEMPAIKYGSLASRIKARLPFNISKASFYKSGSIQEQLNMFIDNIANNKNHELPNASDGKRALEAILAVYKSSRTGREVIIK